MIHKCILWFYSKMEGDHHMEHKYENADDEIFVFLSLPLPFFRMSSFSTLRIWQY